jgi:hypothetical protein
MDAMDVIPVLRGVAVIVGVILAVGIALFLAGKICGD